MGDSGSRIGMAVWEIRMAGAPSWADSENGKSQVANIEIA